MFRIIENPAVAKQLRRAPEHILKKYTIWKANVRHSGPAGLRALSGYKDKPLHGEWAGFRSSRLNEQWRVIYRQIGDALEVSVERVTPHDYTK